MNKKIGWSESKVKQYGSILAGIVTENLEFAKKHQTGRVTDKVTDVTDFTEGGLRELIGL